MQHFNMILQEALRLIKHIPVQIKAIVNIQRTFCSIEPCLRVGNINIFKSHWVSPVLTDTSAETNIVSICCCGGFTQNKSKHMSVRLVCMLCQSCTRVWGKTRGRLGSDESPQHFEPHASYQGDEVVTLNFPLPDSDVYPMRIAMK